MASAGTDPGRFISIGTKLSVLTFALLSTVSAYIYVDSTRQARQALVEAKLSAATIAVDLVAASLEAPLDFNDTEAVQTELDRLSKNQDVLYAVVWTTISEVPVASLHIKGFEGEQGVPALRQPRTVALSNKVQAVRDIVNPRGKQLGGVLVELSLARENAAYELRQQRILVLTIGVTLALSAMIIGLMRRMLLSPVMRLAAAVKRMERGGEARVDVTAADEIGMLGGAFNEMAAAISDRERRLAAARASLQEVLDNMRQAIVVFGPGGVIEGAPSRQAEVIFGESAAPMRSIKDVLYPGALPTDVEPIAFEEWLAITFDTPAEQWSEIAELAPQEVVIERPGEEPKALALELRPVVEGGEIKRVMLLATDETDKRRLEREVVSQELEHKKQMAAMRRLVASGAQAFVGFLEGTRGRIARSIAALDAAEKARRALSQGDIDEIFRHAHTIKGEARIQGLRELEAEASAIEDLLTEARGSIEGANGAGEQVVRAIRESLLRAEEAVLRARQLFVEASPIGEAVLDQITVRRSALDKVCAIVDEARAGNGNGEGGADGRAARPWVDELERAVTELASRPFGESAADLLDAASNLASARGKQIEIEIEGRDAPIPPDLARVLRGSLTHLVRNAVAHAIEPPEERARAGKSPFGTIHIQCAETHDGGDGGIVITVTDDGRGLDRAAISARAEALNVHKNGAREEDLIFHQGLSTAESISDLAGRGVGLAAVASELASVGWEIAAESEAGKGTRFTLRRRRSIVSTRAQADITKIGSL